MQRGPKEPPGDGAGGVNPLATILNGGIMTAKPFAEQTRCLLRRRINAISVKSKRNRELIVQSIALPANGRDPAQQNARGSQFLGLLQFCEARREIFGHENERRCRAEVTILLYST
jgi:hypothetical protein